MKKRYLCALFLLACVAFGANAAAAQSPAKIRRISSAFMQAF